MRRREAVWTNDRVSLDRSPRQTFPTWQAEPDVGRKVIVSGRWDVYTSNTVVFFESTSQEACTYDWTDSTSDIGSINQKYRPH